VGLQNLGWKIGWWESLQDPQKILVKNNRFSQKKPKGVNSLIILIVLAKPIYIYIYSQYFPYFPNISIIFVLASIDLCIFSPRLGLIRFLAPFRLINAYGVFPPEALPQAMPWWNARVLWCFMAIEAPKMDIGSTGFTFPERPFKVSFVSHISLGTWDLSWNRFARWEARWSSRAAMMVAWAHRKRWSSLCFIPNGGMGGVYHQTLGRYVNLQTLEFFSGA
jgi:hypothetical protein